MRDYRAYILGIDGHRFVKVKDFLSDQPDDATALSAAKTLADGHEVELWDCGRLVARLSPNGEVTSPDLAPFMFSAALSESRNVSSKPTAEAISLSRVSELAKTPSSENHLLLGW
jgi:antitoxin (DNA-binding transcriptional repressor) of toxin-antitoxin stability system